MRIILITALLLSLPLLSSAFGVSPPWINQSNLVPGSHFEKEIFLVRANAEEPLNIEAQFDVPEEIRSWFSIDKGLKFTIPAGTQKFPIIVNIDVPKGTELGFYKGFLRVRSLPKTDELKFTGASIATGARIDINLTVGDNIVVDFAINKMDILDIKEGEPAQVLVRMENRGNVETALDRANFELFDKYGEVRLGFAQTENLPKVPPFKTKEFVLDFDLPIKLAIGEYWAKATVYKDGVSAGEIKTVFNVTEKKSGPIIWVGGAVGLIILAGASFWIRRKFLTPRKRKG